MTREEAIEIINRENDPNDKKVWELFPEYREALDMAIKALKQNESAEEWYKLFVEKLDEQKPCDDAISRDAVLEAVSEGCEELRGVYGRCEKLINALPSVTQKSGK